MPGHRCKVTTLYPPSQPAAPSPTAPSPTLTPILNLTRTLNPIWCTILGLQVWCTAIYYLGVASEERGKRFAFELVQSVQMWSLKRECDYILVSAGEDTTDYWFRQHGYRGLMERDHTRHPTMRTEVEELEARFSGSVVMVKIFNKTAQERHPIEDRSTGPVDPVEATRCTLGDTWCTTVSVHTQHIVSYIGRRGASPHECAQHMLVRCANRAVQRDTSPKALAESIGSIESIEEVSPSTSESSEGHSIRWCVPHGGNPLSTPKLRHNGALDRVTATTTWKWGLTARPKGYVKQGIVSQSGIDAVCKCNPDIDVARPASVLSGDGTEVKIRCVNLLQVTRVELCLYNHRARTRIPPLQFSATCQPIRGRAGLSLASATQANHKNSSSHVTMCGSPPASLPASPPGWDGDEEQETEGQPPATLASTADDLEVGSSPEQDGLAVTEPPSTDASESAQAAYWGGGLQLGRSTADALEVEDSPVSSPEEQRESHTRGKRRLSPPKGEGVHVETRRDYGLSEVPNASCMWSASSGGVSAVPVRPVTGAMRPPSAPADWQRPRIPGPAGEVELTVQQPPHLFQTRTGGGSSDVTMSQGSTLESSAGARSPLSHHVSMLGAP